jgi:predicted TIM-barrel fold metal-dependent hydrolase
MNGVTMDINGTTILYSFKFVVDYSFVTPQEAVRRLEKKPVGDSDKEKIYIRNAEQVLRL